MKKLSVLFLLFCLLSGLFFAQQDSRDVPPDQIESVLNSQSLTLTEQLKAWKQSYNIILEELTQLRSSLTISESERKNKDKELTRLYEALRNINTQCQSYCDTIASLETKLAHEKKIKWTGWIVAVGLAAVLILLIINRIKKFIPFL